MADQSTAAPTEPEGPSVNDEGLDTTPVDHDAIEADTIEADLKVLFRDAIDCRLETLGITGDMPRKLAWYESQYTAWQDMNKMLWEDNRAVLTALRRQNDEITATQQSLQTLADENASLKRRIRDLNVELQRPPPPPPPVIGSPEYRELQLAHERLRDAHRTALKDIRQLDFALSRQPPASLASSSSASTQTLVGSSESAEGSSTDSYTYDAVPVAAAVSESPQPGMDASRLPPELGRNPVEDVAQAIERAKETIFARYRPFDFTDPSHPNPTQEREQDMDQEYEDYESRSSTSTMESSETEDDGYSAAVGAEGEEEESEEELEDGELLDADESDEQSLTGEPEPAPEDNEGASSPSESLDQALYEQQISGFFIKAEGDDNSGHRICKMCRNRFHAGEVSTAPELLVRPGFRDLERHCQVEHALVVRKVLQTLGASQ